MYLCIHMNNLERDLNACILYILKEWVAYCNVACTSSLLTWCTLRFFTRTTKFYIMCSFLSYQFEMLCLCVCNLLSVYKVKVENWHLEKKHSWLVCFDVECNLKKVMMKKYDEIEWYLHTRASFELLWLGFNPLMPSTTFTSITFSKIIEMTAQHSIIICLKLCHIKKVTRCPSHIR